MVTREATRLDSLARSNVLLGARGRGGVAGNRIHVPLRLTKAHCRLFANREDAFNEANAKAGRRHSTAALKLVRPSGNDVQTA